jgi:hypothetical protein
MFPGRFDTGGASWDSILASKRITRSLGLCSLAGWLRASEAPANYALVLTPLLLPPVALALAWDRAASPWFSLTLVGWLAFVFGPFLISRFGAEPLYDVILGWPVQSPPTDWQTTRERYFRLNLIRLIGSGSAFLLFLLALNLSLS